MSKRKHKPKTGDELVSNCFNCENCQYIGEGDHVCDIHQVGVICEWEVTEDFYYCCGKDFVER